MNNILIKFLLPLVMVIFSVSACDFLETEQTDALDPSLVFDNITNAERVLLGVYSAYSGGGYITNTARMADNLKLGTGNNGQGVFIHSWLYDGGDNLGWSTGYRTIYRANDVIFKIDDTPGATTEEINQIKGEAIAMRAIAHFDLVRMFAPRYSEGTGNLAIPYIDTPNDILNEPAKNTVGEVYTNILGDLSQAVSLISTTSDKSRITPLAIEAILARIALEMGDYPTAATHAANVINDPLAPELATGADYAQMFILDISGETILSFLNSGTFGQAFYGELVGNYFEVNDDFVNLFDAGDIRAEVNFGQRVPNENNVEKYPGRTGTPDQFGANNIKYLRLSEMYLILAEANFRNNGTGLTELNAVRAARSAAEGTEAGQALFDAIILERRKEMAFEADRWFTLKRLGLGVNRIDCNAGQCALEASDYHWTAAIPQDEINANANMVQNFGY